MFSVVKYITEEDSIGVVATKWLFDDGKKTLYPNSTSDAARDRLARELADPTPKWTSHCVKVLSQHDDYSVADSRADKATYTSNDLSSDEEEEKMKDRKIRKRKTIVLPGEEEEEEVIENICREDTAQKTFALPTPPPKKPKLSVTTSSQSPSPQPFLASSSNTFPSGGLLPRPLFNTSSALSSTSRDCDRVAIAELQQTVGELCNVIKTLSEKIDILVSNAGKANLKESDETVSNRLSEILPFTNKEEMEAFDEELKDDLKLSKGFVQYLVNLGGKDLRAVVANCLRKVMVCEVANLYSYSGKTFADATKTTFSKTHICKSVHDAARIRLKNEATEDSVKLIMSNWLQQAKTRISRRGKGKE